jgi:hypothetical protein
MRYRKLRIAFSIACGIACVLLVVLWMRSWAIQSPGVSWYGDAWKYQVPGKRYFKMFSNRGAIRLSTASFVGGWSAQVLEESRTVLGFGVLKGQTSLYAQIPHWFLVSLAAIGAAVPWIPWSKRFSLRTLLIAMTLVAAGLGLIVALSR